MELLLEAHKQCCNEDSSIWLLRKGDRDLALFSGDSTDETMRAALCGRQVRPRLHKLSHHGICTRYFSEYVEKILRPEILVVSVDKIHYTEEVEKSVDALCAAGGSRVHYTFPGRSEAHPLSGTEGSCYGQADDQRHCADGGGVPHHRVPRAERGAEHPAGDLCADHGDLPRHRATRSTPPPGSSSAATPGPSGSSCRTSPMPFSAS